MAGGRSSAGINQIGYRNKSSKLSNFFAARPNSKIRLCYFVEKLKRKKNCILETGEKNNCFSSNKSEFLEFVFSKIKKSDVLWSGYGYTPISEGYEIIVGV